MKSEIKWKEFHKDNKTGSAQITVKRKRWMKDSSKYRIFLPQDYLLCK